MRNSMHTARLVYWQEDAAWLGYVEDCPDYWTQRETLDDVKDHLKEIYGDLISGELPGIRCVGEVAL